MELHDKINYCIAMEQAAASIYRTFIKKFPREKGFWDDLLKDEMDHLAFLKGANYLEVFTRMPTGVQPPPETSIKDNLKFAKDISRQIKSNPVSIKKALKVALRLEETITEIFTNDLIAELETDNEKLFASDFRKILKKEKSHINKIRKMIKRKGL